MLHRLEHLKDLAALIATPSIFNIPLFLQRLPESSCRHKIILNAVFRKRITIFASMRQVMAARPAAEPTVSPADAGGLTKFMAAQLK